MNDSPDAIYAQTLSTDGYIIGTDSCLDRCWQDFENCLRNTSFPEQCIATLEACKRSCAGGGQ